MADGIPDWPHDRAMNALGPDWFRGLVAERTGPAPIVAISTGDTPGLPSIYDGQFVTDQIADFYRRLEDLPPAVERISLHPDELLDFTSRFPRSEPPGSAFGLGALMSVPIVTDLNIPPNTLRVRRGGVDTDYPIRPKAWMWPKGYEQPDSARLVSRNPDVYRSSPLRRIPWWRRWRRR